MAAQIKQIAGANLPDKIQVFRPKTLGLLTAATQKLGIDLEATRNTPVIKKVLTERYREKYPNYNPLKLERPVPQPLPENLWGEEWTFASVLSQAL